MPDIEGTEMIATIPFSAIDDSRIAMYEDKISHGARPLSILFQHHEKHVSSDHSFQTCSWSQYYVIDGHHKLLAYHKLKIPPPLVIISQHFLNPMDEEIHIPALEKTLLLWQMKHIRENLG